MAATDPKILLIEDEPEIRRFLRVSLTDKGYQISEATNGAEGLQLAASKSPDVVILDLGLPDMDGKDVARQLREWSSVPIIILSARDQEMDKIDALDIGADDYLTKPFGIMELLARIRVALRHSAKTAGEANDPIFTAGTLRVDMASRLVTVDGAEVHLTPIEYKILLMLVKNAGKVVTQQTLLRDVWGPGYAKESHYVRVYMGQLRHKLESDPARPQFIITEPGVGYRLKV
jgi:two-component system, OmpR family, KDP operon response regulator KdpE